MKTRLITSCSSGFGQRLALAAAQRGDRVIATARNVKTIDRHRFRPALSAGLQAPSERQHLTGK